MGLARSYVGLCWPSVGACWPFLAPYGSVLGSEGSYPPDSAPAGSPGDLRSRRLGGRASKSCPGTPWAFICRLETLNSLRSRKFLARCARAIALNPGILWFIMVVMELSRDQGGLSWVRCRAVLTFCADLQMHKIGAALRYTYFQKPSPEQPRRIQKPRPQLKNLEPPLAPR